MRRHFSKLLLTLLLLGGAVALLWRPGQKPDVTAPPIPQTSEDASSQAFSPADPKPFRLLSSDSGPVLVQDSAALRVSLRLSNTTRTFEQLYQSDDAILLANALIDTKSQAPLQIPSHLRSEGDPGSYIVQSRGPLSDGFRQLLAKTGAQIVSYIPNNAYLVRASAGVAKQIAAARQTQSVQPYEPYYKLSADLLKLAVQQRNMALDAKLSLTLFPDLRDDTIAKLEKLGAQILSEEPSPFGPVVAVQFVPKDSLPALARLPGVQGLETCLSRIAANDLARSTMGVSFDTVATTNYQYLTGSNGVTGSNVLVAVVDTGVDSNHVDLVGRVLGDDAAAFRDTSGHGTHVAGIIASTGQHGPPGTNVSGSVANASFRGKAPGAKLFSMSTASHGSSLASDFYYQQTAASSNAFISNNSWDYATTEYSINAASYDAAVRDALPYKAGSQPLLFVFSAGNAGTGLQPGSILAPGTAKNVITVGALEQLRNITNQVHIPKSDTNGTAVWADITDSSTEVARFSSRGNVGIGIEGPSGRFKPDVVAPGVFVVSCRSTMWDTNAYYDNTNYYTYTYKNLHVDTNDYWRNLIYIPDNAVWFSVSVVPNKASPIPFPPMPIFVRQGDLPNPTNSVYDFVGTNTVRVPPDATLVTGDNYGYSIGNVTNRTVSFDIVSTIAVTNDYGDWFEVLAGMNDALGPYYRYEGGTRPGSFEQGTSLAAADVSGFLALVQQYLDERLGLTNRSPALMKALLINGARSLGQGYRFPIRETLNLQGWGLPYLPTTLPAAIGAFTNSTGSGLSNSLWMVDQSLTNALSTGWRQTRNISVDPYAQGDPLRITLVWTDPPGNPNASLKLVNDLDLIVTNLDTGAVYYGNDFGPNSDYTMPWPTNEVPRFDSVNNVENVYLPSPLGTNYSITVLGHRVNVNAITARTNEVAQDYALVISCGDGYITNAISMKASLVESNALPNVTSTFGSVSNGAPLMNQIVGASSPLVGTNLLTNAISYGVICTGVTNQWTFYVITNVTSFTNAAFVTFMAPNLALPRMAVQAPEVANQGRAEADIDLYVSTLPALTNLDATAVATADKSLSRGGTEMIIYSNSVGNRVYFVGVKSEDQMASTYGFAAIFSELPFAQMGSNGMVLHGGPVFIPDGTPEEPNAGLVFCLNPMPMKVRRALPQMNITHEDFGDLLGNLSHNQKSVVLNNHTTGNGNTNQTLIYDDSGEGSVANSQPTDGPGTLNDFMGANGVGVWMLAMIDNAMFNTGVVNSVDLTVEPQPDDGKGVTVTVQPKHWFYEVVDVPVGAVDLTVSLMGNQFPMEIYIRKGALPTFTDYDKKSVPPIMPPGGYLSLSKYDSPPLSPGRYYIGIYNPNNVPQTVTIVYHITVDLGSVVPTVYTSPDFQTIPDDMISYASMIVTNTDLVAAVNVGLRIEHPRVSDLAATLISPSGTRVLLVENRGYATTNGFGSDTLSTNVVPVDSSGGAEAYTNVVDTGSTSGMFTIAWEFYSIPDRLKAYYGGSLVFDTGLVSSNGVANVNYGPGTNTDITVTVNEGNNPDQNTAWTYTLTSTRRKYQYLVLTEDTNLTHTPIKFAQPPLGAIAAASNIVSSSFEGVPAASYPIAAKVDGWTVTSNQVTVVTTNASIPITAYAGSNYLSLDNGAISRIVPTFIGKKYVINLASRKTLGLDGLVGWWRAEIDTSDSSGSGNNGTAQGGLAYAQGMVGSAFNFDGTTAGVRIPAKPNLNVGAGNGMTIEGWIKPSSLAAQQPLVEWNSGSGSGGAPVGAHFWISVALWPGNGPGCLYANIRDTAGLDHMITSAAGLLVTSAYQHVAMTYDKVTGVGTLYINGAMVAQKNLGIFTPQTSFDCYLGVRPAGAATARYSGLMDEFSIYSRSLPSAEIKAIYTTGSAGKCSLPTPPNGCAVAGGTVSIDGTAVSVLTPNDTNWVISSVNFTAVSTGTVVSVEASSGLASGLLLDQINVAPDFDNIYFLPESPLDVFMLNAESAEGEWKLELWDNRVGATNPVPRLLSWQLTFYFVNTVPAPAALSHGQAVTNTIPAGGMVTYEVPVPLWAKFATNTLSGNGPMNLFFDQTTPPTGTNTTSVILLTNVNTGSAVLSAISKPPLVTGDTYYLGVQNKGAGPVTFTIEVDFDITPLANNVPVSSTASAASIPRYFQFDVSAADTAVVFTLTNMNGDANLYVRRGTPLPNPAFFDYAGVNSGSAAESIVIFTNSIPYPLAPGRYYLGVFNNDYYPVSYTIVATRFTNGIPNIITLTNGIAYTATSTPGNSADYYRFVVPADAVRGQFDVTQASGPTALYMRHGFPPLPSALNYAYASTNPGTNGQLISIFDYSPIPLQQGDWFLVVTNVAATPVNYTITASTWPFYGSYIYVNAYLDATNLLCLSWNSLPGVRYVVQGRPDLLSPGWFDASPTITPTDYEASWCIGANSPYSFFRVVEGISTNTSPASGLSH